MRETLEDRDHREVDRIARRRLEGTNATFAKHDVRIAARHDVLRAHEELLQSGAHAALEENRLLRLRTDLAQEVEVLHVPGTDLNDVHVIEERQVLYRHQLGDDRKSRLLPCFDQEVESLLAETLEGVRGGARLERTATEQGRASGLHGLRDADHLLFALDAARPRDDLEVPAADLHAGAIDDRILRMELAVRGLIGLLDALDGFDRTQLLDETDVDFRDVADASDQRFLRTLRHMRRDVPRQKPALQVLDLAPIRILLQYDYHLICLSFFKSMTAPLSVERGRRTVPRVSPISLRQPRSGE